MISVLDDRVTVCAPDVFNASALSSVEAFAGLVFMVEEVSRFDVDFDCGQGTIRLCSGADIASCLNRLAEQLRAPKLAVTGGPPASQNLPGEQMQFFRPHEVVLSRAIVREGKLPPGSATNAGGLRRITYLTLAGASFGMAVVGVAVPGIPTVPFVLVCSYFLVRSSPPMHQRLINSRVFGPLLHDWHAHHGMRLSVKVIAVVTLVLMVMASVMLAGLAAPIAMIVVLAAAVGVWMIWRTPTVGSVSSEIHLIGRIGPRLAIGY